MTEVENCGGEHHTRLKINLCVYGVPPPPYIKDGGGEGRPAPRERPKRGILLGLQVLVGIHQKGERGKEGRGGREGKGAPPPSPSPIRTHGAHGQHLLALRLFLLMPIEAH